MAFDKYNGLERHPNGRPVGVRNGQGSVPAVPQNPMLRGMQHTVTPLSATPQGPVQQRRIAAGAPAVAEGTVETLLDWARKNVGGR